MHRRLAWVLLLLGVAGPSARAQIAFSRNLLPTRTALERLGLEQHWSGIVPMGHPTERLVRISLADRLLFAQTTEANFHCYDAESGRYLWGLNLGRTSLVAYPASVNSTYVFVTNAKTLFCLDRRTGHIVWRTELEDFPSTATAADEETVVVGQRTGKLSAFNVKDHTHDERPGLSAGANIFNWQTGGEIRGRPIPAGKVIAFGSRDGRAYVAQLEPPILLFRFLTGGPISASMGTQGERTLLIPSEDNNLYAIDLFTAETRWVFPSGAPIDQEPLVSGIGIYVVNTDGEVRSIDHETGEPRWAVKPGLGRLLTIGERRIYTVTDDHDLVIIDRETGRLIYTPRDTYERAGLRLRDFTLDLTNRLDDRLYFATPSGLLLTIRETGRIEPTFLRDPKKEKPFGQIPELEESGTESVTPPVSPPAAPEAEMPAEEPAPAVPAPGAFPP